MHTACCGVDWHHWEARTWLQLCSVLYSPMSASKGVWACLPCHKSMHWLPRWTVPLLHPVGHCCSQPGATVLHSRH